ncbi:MAG TPA: hypothetical protein ENL35_06340 [Chloroflexi bacterium]|nr:hypothetical protein [Chloroflexota bacterium]
MDILGIGPLELLFILLLALVLVGPRDMRRFGRSLGRFLNRMYRSESWRVLNEASRTLRTLPNRLAREAALEELDSVRREVEDAGKELRTEVRDADQSLRAWTEIPPQTPADGESSPAAGAEPEAEDPSAAETSSGGG